MGVDRHEAPQGGDALGRTRDRLTQREGKQQRAENRDADGEEQQHELEVACHGYARATSDLHMKMLQRVGADRVVFPSKMMGRRLGVELVRPNLLEQLRLDDRNCIEEIKVPKAFVGHSLRDLNLRKHFNVNVLAAGPVGHLDVNPPASHVLAEGELLVVMGSEESLRSLPGS